MAEHISNGHIVSESRYGWNARCPKCSGLINYTILNIDPGMDVFLHCERCSNFCLRSEDREVLLQMLNAAEANPEEALAKIYKWLIDALPSCGCGGNFTLWANVKCPSCGEEIPYNNGVRDLEVRFHESKIVWSENSVAYRGAREPSNRLVEVVIGG